MRSPKKTALLLAVSISLAGVFGLLGPLGMTAKVQAQEEALHEQINLTLQMQASPKDIILVTFTDTSPIPYTDLSGNLIGEGVHVGQLWCAGDICNHKIEFEAVSPQPTTDTVVYEYKFKSRLLLDPVAEIVVVSGTGTMSNGGQKTKFSVTGVFQNNGDGTVSVTYNASTPDASFIFPAAPGTFRIISP